MRCRKCGSEKMGVMPNKKNPAATDLYCLECGAWQKFATRDEIRLYQTRKFVITNADRIRTMSDKELAELMRSMMNCDSCGNMFSFKCDGSYEHCSSVCLNWLQQPFGEEDDHA